MDRKIYDHFSARGQLAARVESKKNELLSRNSSLSERDAFLAASAEVCKQNRKCLQPTAKRRSQKENCNVNGKSRRHGCQVDVDIRCLRGTVMGLPVYNLSTESDRYMGLPAGFKRRANGSVGAGRGWSPATN